MSILTQLEESLGLQQWSAACAPEKSEKRNENWNNLVSVGRILDVVLHQIREDGNNITPQEERGLKTLEQMSSELVRLGTEWAARTE